MEDLVLLDAVERYLRGDMTPAELADFENMRRKNADLDQLVVEQQMFLNQLSNWGIEINNSYISGHKFKIYSKKINFFEIK